MRFLYSLCCGSLVRAFGLLLVLIAGPVAATQQVAIYEASALVKNQTDGERNRAAREAFAGVVVRVSGQKNALTNEQVLAASKQAAAYLVGYSYSASNQVIVEEDKRFPATEIKLQYSAEAITKLLSDAQLPLWPAQRPKILTILLVQDASGIHFSTAPELLEPLSAQAAYRGLPIVISTDSPSGIWPLTAEKMWYLSGQDVQSLLQKQKVDAVLIARYTSVGGSPIPSVNFDEESDPSEEVDANQLIDTYSPNDSAVLPSGPWVLDWNLIQAKEHTSANFTVPDIGAAIIDQVDQVADFFANKYSVVASNTGPQKIYLKVNGVNSFAAYKRVQAYLKNFTVIKRVDVAKIDAQEILLGLSIEGDIKLLVSTLALGKQLIPEDAAQLMEINNAVDSAEPAVAPLDEAALAAQLDAEIAQENGLQGGDLIPALGVQNELEQAEIPTIVSQPIGAINNPLVYQWQ